MLAAPDNVRLLGQNLDHPEGICIGPDGTVYTGGEAGQVYRLTPEGRQEQYASTGGFLLGIALDGTGNIHACDAERRSVLRIAPDGTVIERSRGTPERRMVLPNFPGIRCGRQPVYLGFGRLLGPRRHGCSLRRPPG